MGHAVLASILWNRARSLDLANKSAITSFYMFIWKVFCSSFIPCLKSDFQGRTSTLSNFLSHDTPRFLISLKETIREKPKEWGQFGYLWHKQDKKKPLRDSKFLLVLMSYILFCLIADTNRENPISHPVTQPWSCWPIGLCQISCHMRQLSIMFVLSVSYVQFVS